MARFGNVPTVSAYQGNAGQRLMQIGETLEGISQGFEEKQQAELAQAKKLYEQGLNIGLYNSINELRNDPNLSANPQGLASAMDKVLEKTLADVTDDDVKMNVMVDYQLKKGTYINKAQTEFNKIQRQKAKSYAFDSVYANIDSMGMSFANALTGNSTNDDIANYQHSLNAIKNNINAKNPDGTYIFTDTQRRAMTKDAEKYPVTAFKSMYDDLPQEQKDSIRESINNDRMDIVTTEQGSIRLRDIVGDENYQNIKNFVNEEEYKRVSLENKRIKTEKMRQQINQYDTEVALSEQLDDMDLQDALKTLDEKQGEVSEKYYKAKQKALLSANGIDAETRAETATDLYMQINAINTDDVKKFYSKSSDVLAKIEESYSEGKLGLADKKALEKNLKERQAKAIPDYIKEDNAWFSYDAGDAMEDLESNLSNAVDVNDTMLSYIRITSKDDYTAKQKKSLIKDLISNTKKKNLEKAMFGISVGDIKDGYRYKGGNPNEESSWEKI